MVTAAVNNLVFKRPVGFTDTPTTYCPGCTHGVAHRLVAEVLEEMGIIEKTIGVAPVGCAVFAFAAWSAMTSPVLASILILERASETPDGKKS